MDHKIVIKFPGRSSYDPARYIFVCNESFKNKASTYGRWAMLAMDNRRLEWLPNKYVLDKDADTSLGPQYWNRFCPLCRNPIFNDEELSLLDTIFRMGGEKAVVTYLQEHIIES